MGVNRSSTAAATVGLANNLNLIKPPATTECKPAGNRWGKLFGLARNLYPFHFK